MGRHSSPAEQNSPDHPVRRDPHRSPALALLAPSLVDPSTADRTQPIPVQGRTGSTSGRPRHALTEQPRTERSAPRQRRAVVSQPLPVMSDPLTSRQPDLPWSAPETSLAPRFSPPGPPAPNDGWLTPPPSAYAPPRPPLPDFRTPPPQRITPPARQPLRVVPEPRTAAIPTSPRAHRDPRSTALRTVQPTAEPTEDPSGGSPTRSRTEEAEPRLLAGWLEAARPAGLAEHLERHGPLPRADFAGRRGADQLVALTTRAGLRGRGGAGFPTARKMAGVREAATARRRPVVVANGCEGDPTSDKDRLLLHSAPHLVLDGIALAAHAVGADHAILCLHRDSPLIDPVEHAIGERTDDPCDIHVVTTPDRYVASEANALVRFLTEGDARPTTSPPLPSERGVQGRPTLMDNVETLAHLALLARNDDDWFRERGTEQSPGTMLVTVGGVVQRPGVYEVDAGIRAGRLLRLAGGTAGRAQAMLIGGLGGSWLPLPATGNLSLSHEGCAAEGVGLGVASVVVLPDDACGLSVTSAILSYLAAESAKQCGPCMFGLPSIAGDFVELAAGRVDPETNERLRSRLEVIPGRGACAHPDGAVRLAAGALTVFAEDVESHLRGRACGRPDVAALPMIAELSSTQEGWR